MYGHVSLDIGPVVLEFTGSHQICFAVQAGEKKWGTDESRFNVVLASRNFKQLNATFNEYIKVTRCSFIASRYVNESWDGSKHKFGVPNQSKLGLMIR